MKNIMCVLMCVGLASMASGAMSITNGDFEADAIGGSQDFADVAGWYESDAGSFWNKPWFKEGNDSFNGSGVVAFSGQECGPAPDGAGLLGYLYQNIGTADGASQVQIGFQTSTFAGGATKDYGITVTILQSNSFVPGEEVDILGAAGVSFIYQQTRLYTGAAAAGVKDDVWTLDLSSVVPGAGDLYLRLNHYHGAAGNDEPFIHIDNIAILVFDFDPTPADGDTVAVADPLTLSWLNLPDPNNASDPVWVDVYWGTDAAGDGGTLVVTPNDALTITVTPVAESTTYYWKIVATDPNTGHTPYVMGEAVYSLITETTNLVPTIIVTPLGFDYEWLVGGTKTFVIDATVTDVDGLGDHTYTYSVVSGPVGPAATFGTIFESIITATEVDLSADVTFTTAGDYILEVEVNDNDEFYITDTVNVHVYADGCEAAKAETPYTELMAREKGDTNYDCEVNSLDLAAMALNWLADVPE